MCGRLGVRWLGRSFGAHASELFYELVPRGHSRQLGRSSCTTTWVRRRAVRSGTPGRLMLDRGSFCSIKHILGAFTGNFYKTLDAGRRSTDWG